MNEVLWRNFRFIPYDFYTTLWNDVGGVYIFGGFDPQNGWWPLYVGETGSFRSRMPCHERWAEAVGLGATHVLAMTVPAVTRAMVERELISEYQPPLNVQHRSVDLLGALLGLS